MGAIPVLCGLVAALVVVLLVMSGISLAWGLVVILALALLAALILFAVFASSVFKGF